MLDEQPVVRALARLLAHPELPDVAVLPDNPTADYEDLLPWLRERAVALGVGWDRDAFEHDIVEQLTAVHGELVVDDARAPWMIFWGAAAPVALTGSAGSHEGLSMNRTEHRGRRRAPARARSLPPERAQQPRRRRRNHVCAR